MDQRTFAEVLLASYNRQPERTAVTVLQPDQPDAPISYAGLIEGSAGYANALREAGVKPGEVVVLILQHGQSHIFAYFGAILHGAIPSIMPFLTEKLLPERYRASLASLVAITQPAAIITYAAFEGEVRAALHQGDSVRAVIIAEQVLPTPAFDQASLGGLQRCPEDIVLLQHSSGTTGLQKGVALSHAAVFNQLDSYSRVLKLSADDVVVSWLPLYHDMGLIAGFLMPILLRIPLVLMSPFDWVRAPYKLMQAVSRYRGTLSWLPNFAYNFCAKKIRDRHLEGVDLSSWRAISNCSEPMRWESHQLFYERFKGFGLRYEVLNTCYAMAENVFAVTQGGANGPVNMDEIDRETFQTQNRAVPAQAGRPSLKMLSAGKPIPNVEVRVYGADGTPAGEREVGELALHSNCMLSGYYKRPDETAKAFRDGWFLTGDNGYVANGEVYVSGRRKDLIIVGGKNVYPQDIEELVMEVPGVHPGRVSAFGVFDDEAGTEDVVVVAEVEPTDPAEREQIGDAIRQVVTRGSDITLRDVLLVDAQWMVKTSSGKNSRYANREKYLAEIAKT